MTTAKKMGIWLDHSSANLMEFTKDSIETKIITSEFTHDVKEKSLSNKGEKKMHLKEQNKQNEYYKKLGDTIKNYNDVILFGPTEAKVELFNVLRADRGFSNIKIEVKQTDKMTENQQHAFVKEYFLR